MTQRSIARIRRLRNAAGMNSAAATSSPCGVDHAQHRVVHRELLAAQARDRQVGEPEAVLHERGLDLLHPDLVEALHARALVGRLLQHDAVAAFVAADLVGAPRLGEQRIEALRRRSNLGEPDRAGHRQRVVRALEDSAGDAGEGVLRPGFDVAQRAALEEQREDLAAEPPVEVVRLRELAQLLGDLRSARPRSRAARSAPRSRGTCRAGCRRARARRGRRRHRGDRSGPRGTAADDRSPSRDPCARLAR